MGANERNWATFGVSNAAPPVGHYLPDLEYRMPMGYRPSSIPVEDPIMRLAAEQHGIVTRNQLLGAGITLDTVKGRLRSGRLIAVHRGVYRVGPLIAPNAREMAAVLACGPGAVLSHWSAAELWRILQPLRALVGAQHAHSGAGKVAGSATREVESTATREVDITARVGYRRNRPGIRVHNRTSVGRDETTMTCAIPITTPARTLLDLATIATHRELERATAEALALRLTTKTEIAKLAARHHRRHGAARLKKLVEGSATPALTRSEAEERLLALVRKGCLGKPETNARVAGYEVDVLWRAERLIMEVDGQSFHTSNRSFERDRRRDADLVARGFRVVRVTWHQIVNEPESLLVRLAQALVR